MVVRTPKITRTRILPVTQGSKASKILLYSQGEVQPNHAKVCSAVDFLPRSRDWSRNVERGNPKQHSLKSSSYRASSLLTE